VGLRFAAILIGSRSYIQQTPTAVGLILGVGESADRHVGRRSGPRDLPYAHFMRSCLFGAVARAVPKPDVCGSSVYFTSASGSQVTPKRRGLMQMMIRREEVQLVGSERLVQVQEQSPMFVVNRSLAMNTASRGRSSHSTK
jgi:hypothetical protein